MHDALLFSRQLWPGRRHVVHVLQHSKKQAREDDQSSGGNTAKKRIYLRTSKPPLVTSSFDKMTEGRNWRARKRLLMLVLDRGATSKRN